MRYNWWGYAKDMIRRYPLGAVNQNEANAVNAAIAATERLPNGPARLKVIELVLWKGTHTLEGAALQIPCSERTARYWQADFIKLVAKNFCCNGLF